MITKKTKESLDFLEKLAGKLTLGSLLSSIRQGEEMTQIEFAKILSVSKQYLCDLEHGLHQAKIKENQNISLSHATSRDRCRYPAYW